MVRNMVNIDMRPIAEHFLESSQEIDLEMELRANRLAFDPDGRRVEFVIVAL